MPELHASAMKLSKTRVSNAERLWANDGLDQSYLQPYILRHLLVQHFEELAQQPLFECEAFSV